MKILKYISLSLLAVSLFSCEKNDPLADLGDSNGFAPSVNIKEILLGNSGTVRAGSELKLRTSYWLQNGTPTDINLTNRLDSVLDVKLIGVAGTDYDYDVKGGFVGEILPKTVYSTKNHDEKYWSNADYSYKVLLDYTVNKDYKIKKYTVNSTIPMAAYISDEVYEVIYIDCIHNMSKEQLHVALVDNNVMSEDDFNSCFDDNDDFTEVAEEKMFHSFESLDNEILVGSDSNSFTKRITYVEIVVDVDNTFNNIGESNSYYFKVI